MQVQAVSRFRGARWRSRGRNAGRSAGRSVAAVLALVAAQLTVATFGVTAVASAATPGVNSNFDCYGTTIYSDQSFTDGHSAIYALDTSTLGNSQVSSTYITDIPGESDPNALAITTGGTEAITVKRLPEASTVNIYKYAAATSTWTVDPNGTADPAANFVAGAYDPFNQIYYYVDYENPTSVIYGYDVANNQPISGVIATIDMPFPDAADDNGINGDIAFDRQGNLYLVQSQDTEVAIATVPGPLTTMGTAGASAPELTSTTLATYSKPELVRYKGMSLDNFGHMYILYGDDSASTYLQEYNPTTGATISTSSEVGISGSLGTGTDLGACSSVPTLSASVNIAGRSTSSDQFSLMITGSGVTGSNTATTSGNSTGVQSQVAGPIAAVSGTTYTIAQTSGPGSLVNYNVAYDCTDAAAGNRSVASGSGNSITLDFPDPAADSTGAQVTCAFTDTPKPAALDTALTLRTVNGAAPTGDPLQGGEQLVYQVATTNTGGTNAPTTLTDDVPAHTTHAGGGVGWSCNPDSSAGNPCTQTVTVAPGATVTETYTVVVDQPLPQGVSAVRDDVTASSGTCSACSVAYPDAAILDTTKYISTVDGAAATGATQLSSGDVAKYRIKVANAGGASGTTLVTETVPANTTYAGTAEGWSCADVTAGSTCTQSFSVLPTGTTTRDFTVTLGTLPANTTVITNSVTTSAGTCSACTAVNATAGRLDTVKTIYSVNGNTAVNSNTPLKAGDVVVYDDTVNNTGGSSVFTTLTDPVPANATYAGSGEGWSCPTGSVAGTACARSKTIAAGAGVIVQYTITLGNPLTVGTATITSQVTSSAGTCSSCTVINPTVAVLNTVKALATVNGVAATGSSELAAGDVAKYRIRVTNTGGSMGSTTLTETVPAHTIYTDVAEGWTCGGTTAGSICTQFISSPGSSSTQVTFTVTVDALPANTVAIANSVTTSSGTCAMCTVTTPTVAQLNTIETIYQINGGAPTTNVQPGDTVTYLVHTGNDGGSVGSTTITETVPNNSTYTGVGEGWTNTCAGAGTTCAAAISALAPGDTQDYYFTVLVDSSLPPGNLTVTDTSTSAPGNCNDCTVSIDVAPTLDTVAAVSSVAGSPAASSTRIAAGNVVVYTVTVKNTGGSGGTSTISNPVPANATYVGNGEGWSCISGDPAGTPCTQTVTVQAAQQRVLRFTVNIDAPLPAHTAQIVDQSGSTSGSCNCTVTNATVAVLDTALTILTVNGSNADSATQVAAHDTVQYQATVTNTGGSAAIPLLTDMVPRHTTYVGSVEGWACPQTAGGTNCTRGVVVSANSSVSVTFTVQVDKPLAANTLTIDDGVSTSLGICSACSVSNATVAVLNTVKHLTSVSGQNASDSTPLRPQDVATYTITVTNTGGTAASTTLTETVPVNTSYTGDNQGWTCGGTVAGSQCTQTVTVTAGSPAAVFFTVTVASLPLDTADIENVVSTSVGNCSSCAVITPTFAALDTVKSIALVNRAAANNATALAAGDVVAYHVTVSNNGGSTGTTTLTETLPANSTYTGPSTEGWACASGACTQTVTVAAFDAAALTFTITLTSPLPFGTQNVTSAVQSSVGTCSVCTVTNPTVGVLRTYKYLLTVNGNVAASDVRVRGRDVLGYSVLVTNGGGSPATTTLTETVPAHSVYLGKQQGWSCAAPADAGTRCHQSVAVQGGDTEARAFTVAVKTDLLSTDRTIAAAVTTSNGTCPICHVTTPLQVSDLVVTKTADRATAKVGDTVNFTVTVHNNGPDAATAVVLHDVFTGLKYKSAKVTQGTWNAKTGYWTIGTIASGSTSVMHASFVLTSVHGSNVASAYPPVQVDPIRGDNTSSVPISDPDGADPNSGLTPGVPGAVTLASTGVPTWALLRIGGVLLVIGLGLCFATRRRRRIGGGTA